MEFSLEVTVQIKHNDGTFTVKKPVPLQIVYRSGQWQAQCADPPVFTPFFDHMEEAVSAGAKEAFAEMKATV